MARINGEKLIVLGIDAGDLDFIRSRQSKLPTFRRLLGDTKVFQPQAPKALSGSVWPTFYTGSAPGHHGIYQHLVWDADKMGLRLIGPEWCARRPFWADLEDKGRKVTVLDVPYTFPIFLKRGVEISDWGTHGQTRPLSSNRSDVKKFLSKFGKSPIGRETPIKKTARQRDKIYKKLLAGVQRKRDLIVALNKSFPSDVLIASFGETHRAGHIFYSQADAVSEDQSDTCLLGIYRELDQALNCILESVDREKTTIVLFSLHGMMADYGQGHLVKPLMDRLNALFIKRHAAPETPGRNSGGVIRWLRQVAPTTLQYMLAEAAPDRIRQWVIEREIVEGIDWSKTPAFPLRTDIRAELRLNLLGRESQGFLEIDGSLRQIYTEWLHRAFLELKDKDTGQALVDEVVPIQKIFPGKYSHALPDFAITWRAAPLAHRVSSSVIGDIQAVPGGARGGDHTDFGFAAISASTAVRKHLCTNSVPRIKHIWELARLITRLDELADD